MFPTSFLNIINTIALTNTFSSSNICTTFPLSIYLSDFLRCSSTIVMYFTFLMLLNLLVLSVGTITTSISSKLCRSLLISWSFSLFYGISVFHSIDKSSLSNWVRRISNWFEPFIALLDFGHKLVLRPSSSIFLPPSLPKNLFHLLLHIWTKIPSIKHRFIYWSNTIISSAWVKLRDNAGTYLFEAPFTIFRTTSILGLPILKI